MKKFLSALALCTLCISLAACTNSKASPTEETTEATTEVTTKVTTEATTEVVET